MLTSKAEPVSRTMLPLTSSVAMVAPPTPGAMTPPERTTVEPTSPSPSRRALASTSMVPPSLLVSRSVPPAIVVAPAKSPEVRRQFKQAAAGLQQRARSGQIAAIVGIGDLLEVQRAGVADGDIAGEALGRAGQRAGIHLPAGDAVARQDQLASALLDRQAAALTVPAKVPVTAWSNTVSPSLTRAPRMLPASPTSVPARTKVLPA